ncbi:MAG TPA: hypothetical protein VN915_17370 [Elusimicrobiota bacterium]|nr:hypothetical protein [Elusimicrobiota bacterium]
MKRALAGLLLASAVPVRAQIVMSVPRINAAPSLAAAAAAPMLAAPAALAAPALFAAPSLAAPSLSAAPALSAMPAALAPSAAFAPAAVPAAAAASLPAAAALAPAPAAAPQDGPEPRSPESLTAAAAAVFDGAGQKTGVGGPVFAAPGAASPDGPGWSRGSFEGEGGLPVVFKRRSGPAGKAPRVYFGGLALNESYDALFARAGAPARSEYFAWTRGHAPTGWTPTSSVIDADARDLARMIVVAGRETGSPKVELAVHSFGAGVFQRMLQLRKEPEVRKALKLLAGSRVVVMNGMTHYDDVEKLGGPSVEQMAQATKMTVEWLDSWDALARQVEANLANPFLAMQAQLWLAGYRFQREQLLSAATKGAVDAMRHDLALKWDPDVDPIRRGFQKALDKDARDEGWQESLLRRSRDAFVLDFKTADAGLLRRIGTRVEFIHSLQDQLLDWQAAQLLFGRFGIATPPQAPAAGAVLSDGSGLFTATVVNADHYYPLKKSADLAQRLDP